MNTNSPVLDATGDVTRQETYKFSQLYEFPEYVKSASTSQLMDPNPDLPANCYADPRRRQFCCATKAATWLSYLFFLEKQGQMHPKIASWVEQRLDGHAQYWGLSSDIQALKARNAEINTEKRADADYMLVWKGENGVTDRQYPISNSNEVKKAADWFVENRDHFVFKDRHTMAEKLLEKANQYGVALGEEVEEIIEKQAGRGSYIPKEAAEMIRNRVRASGPPAEFRERMEKLASAVEDNPALATDAENTRKLAHTIDQFDRMVNLVGGYTERIPRPEDVLFKVSWKTARAALDDSCRLTTGSVYSKQDFSKVALSDIRDVFGNDIADEVADGILVCPEKMADIVSTFPRGDAQLFDRVMSDSGIFPMAKSATTVDRPSFEELMELSKIDEFRRGLPLLS